MHAVHIDGIRLLGQVDEGEPDISQGNFLTVVADASDNLVLAVAGIFGTQIVPSDTVGCHDQVNYRIFGRERSVDSVFNNQFHVGTASVREVERVGIVIGIGDIIDQEIIATVVKIAISGDKMEQLVSA